jgi:hypothetical protein
LLADSLRGVYAVPCVDAGMVFEFAGDGAGDTRGVFSWALLLLGGRSDSDEQQDCGRERASEAHVEEPNGMVTEMPAFFKGEALAG